LTLKWGMIFFRGVTLRGLLRGVGVIALAGGACIRIARLLNRQLQLEPRRVELCGNDVASVACKGLIAN
jgi:hypothetical protein